MQSYTHFNCKTKPALKTLPGSKIEFGRFVFKSKQNEVFSQYLKVDIMD